MTFTYADADAMYNDKIARSRTYSGSVRAVRLPGTATMLRKTGDGYAIQYHRTDVVTLHPDGSVTLYTGGYETVTTVQRMHEYTPAWLVVNGKDILSKRWDAYPRVLVSRRDETGERVPVGEISGEQQAQVHPTSA